MIAWATSYPDEPLTAEELDRLNELRLSQRGPGGVEKFNPNHDELGRFASGDASAASEPLDTAADPLDAAGHRETVEPDKRPSPEAEAWLAEVERHPEYLRAKAVVAAGQETAALYAPDGEYTPERRALHEQIVERMLKPGAAVPPGGRKTAILMLGGGGAGKTTTLARVLRDPGKFSIINADDVKAQLPEYNGYNAELLHEESTHVADTVALGRALERDHNIVLDATGKTSSKYERIAGLLREHGYNVQAMHVTAPTLVAAQRAWRRFLTGSQHRFVDPRHIIESVDSRPAVTYHNLKAKGLVSRAVEYDTNVPIGTAPKKVEDVSYRVARRADAPGRAPGGRHRADPRAVARGEEGEGALYLTAEDVTG